METEGEMNGPPSREDQKTGTLCFPHKISVGQGSRHSLLSINVNQGLGDASVGQVLANLSSDPRIHINSQSQGSTAVTLTLGGRESRCLSFPAHPGS